MELTEEEILAIRTKITIAVKERLPNLSEKEQVLYIDGYVDGTVNLYNKLSEVIEHEGEKDEDGRNL